MTHITQLSDLDLLRTVLEEPVNLNGTPAEWFGLKACEPQDVVNRYAAGQAHNVRHRLKCAQELMHRALGEQLSEASSFVNPSQVATFLSHRLGALPYEVFGVMFLNSQNSLIEFVEMFRGTVNQTSVYPREVVFQAVKCNASAVILAHNHPSGDVTPSPADIALTQALKKALDLIDVRILDHIVIGQGNHASFQSKGLL